MRHGATALLGAIVILSGAPLARAAAIPQQTPAPSRIVGRVVDTRIARVPHPHSRTPADCRLPGRAEPALAAGGSGKTMKKLSITEAEAGQVVARPVSTSNGMVMVQPGAPLTVEIIGRLADLGIDTLWVEGVSENSKPVDALIAELDVRFAGHDNDPLMMALKAVVASCIFQGAESPRD